MTPSDPVLGADRVAFATLHRRVDNVERVIRGKTEVICPRRLHSPGSPSSRTSRRRQIPRQACRVHRRHLEPHQFTPDLLPTDVTGVQIFNRQTNTFEFREGGIFANIILGDEINRASPKTQSALLEVMAEYQVTVDSHSYPVPNPFLVIATQNPIEHEGTYNLPEAQIDRFLMRISVGYPDRASEMEIVDRSGSRRKPVTLPPVVTTDEIDAMISLVEHIYVSPAVKQYIVSIVDATRELPQLRLGQPVAASPGPLLAGHRRGRRPVVRHR
jgi:MoxR-like ATPase